MVTIHYKFADGHSEEIAVTETFAQEYVEMEYRDSLVERKETRRHQSLDKSMEHGFDVMDNNADVTMKIEQWELSEQIHNALDSLTDKQRITVALYVFDKLSFRQIGERLGLHKDTVREHYLSAIKKLKKFLLNTPSK